MKKIESIFENVKLIEQKYAKLNRSEAYGFNIFSLLLKSGDEVNLHSKFIYELLNPNGSHHQGSLFLEIFLEKVKINYQMDNTLAFREKHNIDILLKSSKHAIIIENKIYTKDHSSQLSRYWQTLKTQGYKDRNISVIYLTLFGYKPIEKDLKFNVISISYKYTILSWLESCIEKVRNIPILYATILQYIFLIKKLTHQSTDKGSILDVKNLLLKDNNLKIILGMQEAIIEAKIEIQFNFWQTLLAKLIPHYAFTFYNMNNDKGLKSSIRRYYQQKKNIKDYGIQYEIEDNLYFFVELRENIYYGFYFEDEDMIEDEQKEALESLDTQWNEITQNIYWKYPDKTLNFKAFNHQNIFDLLDEESKKRDIGIISDKIINFIRIYKEKKC